MSMHPETESARRDLRVGDKWTWQDATLVVAESGNNKITYDATQRCTGKTTRVSVPIGEWHEKIPSWRLAERGPAPERDPHTQPVVGDEWTFADQKRRIRFVIGDDLKVDHIYSDGTFSTFRYTTNEVASYVGIWTLHRRGDDPAWRPEGERSEQSAPGIKVGDRVRLAPVGEMGNVTSKDDYGVKILFDDADKPQTFSYRDVEHWLTIIPPAADASEPPFVPEEEVVANANDELLLRMQYIPDPVEEQHYRDDKYIRSIRAVKGEQSIDVDVYEVLEAFNVTCPARQHALKKLLCAGLRNKGSVMQDLREAEACVRRAMKMQFSREAVAAAKGTTT